MTSFLDGVQTNKALGGWAKTVFTEFLIFSLQGFLVKILWVWFLMPFGAPKISFAHGMGIILIIWVLMGYGVDTEKASKSYEELVMEIREAILDMSWILLLGWTLHFFI